MHPTRVTRRAGVVAILAAVLAVLPGAPALADPDPATIEAQINAEWRQAEPLIEEYNHVHEEFERNKVLQAELQAKLDPLEAQLNEARVRIGAVSARAYMGGQPDLLDVLLSGASPEQLADQLTYLDVLARDQTRQLSAVIDAKREFDVQKAPIDALVAELGQQDAELSQRKQEIDARIDELQRMRIEAYGNSGGTGSLRPVICPLEYLPTPGYQAAAFACNEAGKPYIWAASGPNSYDCSGLTLRGWAQVGVYLPHNAAAQRRSMPYVDRSDLQIGDLVFYYNDLSHVGMYVGGDWIIHAPMAGDVVRMAKMEYGAPIHSFGRPG